MKNIRLVFLLVSALWGEASFASNSIAFTNGGDVSLSWIVYDTATSTQYAYVTLAPAGTARIEVPPSVTGSSFFQMRNFATTAIIGNLTVTMTNPDMWVNASHSAAGGYSTVISTAYVPRGESALLWLAMVGGFMMGWIFLSPLET